jgi:spore maturation protein CgeB
MNIAFFGSSLVSAYWNGAATYYRGIIRALAGRGHRVTFHEPDAFERQQHRDMEPPDWATVRVYPATEMGVHRALKEARDADVVVKASGVGVFDALLEEAVLELRRPETAVIYWDVDAPATLDRLAADPGDPFRHLVPRYDLILTYGGGPPVVEAFLALGARACVPVYNALDTATHYPVRPQSRFVADLTFLGNRLPDREARVERFFLEVAGLLPDRNFLLGGSGWGDKPMPANVRYLGHVYTTDHNYLNSSALAVLNINRESMATYGFSPPTRVFEAAGVGACLITDHWQGIEQFLEPGREILTAADGTEVAGQLSGLTKERARKIGRAGRARILAAHTYHHRGLQVDGLLAGKDLGNQGAAI